MIDAEVLHRAGDGSVGEEISSAVNVNAVDRTHRSQYIGVTGVVEQCSVIEGVIVKAYDPVAVVRGAQHADAVGQRCVAEYSDGKDSDVASAGAAEDIAATLTDDAEAPRTERNAVDTLRGAVTG